MDESILLCGGASSLQNEVASYLDSNAKNVVIHRDIKYLADVDMVIHLGSEESEFITLLRGCTLHQVPLLQTTFKSFNSSVSDIEDLLQAPLLDSNNNYLLLNFGFPVEGDTGLLTLAHNQFTERVSELDNSTLFNSITFQDAGRVIGGITMQILAGSKNRGEYNYATGGTLTWYRFCSFLADLPASKELDVELKSGVGIGVDYSLDSERLNHDFGIQPHSWRDGLEALWVV